MRHGRQDHGSGGQRDPCHDGIVTQEAGSDGGKQLSGTSPYYAFNRADIAQHIPEWATRVLDVGCASGAFGGLLKSLGVSEVIGIEVEPDVCAAAQDVLDCAICGDIEAMDLPFEGGYPVHRVR